MEFDFENQKVIDVDIEREVKKSFMEYAVSVIISRALPDVRDGLKPVQRRILYTMHETKLTPDKPYRKSVTAVGDVLGRYHPHGDSSVYDAMVRLAQDFSLRYPLVDGHGNFGSVDGDPPAAYRYTEARLQKLSLEMLRDIEKNTVEFMPNFDGRLKEPTVLPSRFPNLLVNGSVGIAVGMATNIPPHNLGEVIDGAICLLDNPDAGMDELMQHIKGPDFPTGGIILGMSGIRSAYATGRGHIKVRARTEIQEEPSGKSRIIVTEIPYMVNKAKLCESIGTLVKEKRVEGITAIRDESNRNGMRVVIELSRSANANVVLNQLFQYTQLQDTFAVNMLAIVDSSPKVLTLREALSYYIAHQKEVLLRRTKFDLEQAMARAHILKGLRIAVDHIDEVVHIIRASASVNDAKQALMARFSGEDVSNLLRRGDAYDDEADNTVGLTEEQASAIVAMTLGQLTGLGVDKIEKELAEKMAIIRECRFIIGNEAHMCEILKKELNEIKSRFSDKRRTVIEAVDNEIDVEDLIKQETCVYTLTRLGYIKRLPADTYRVQRRGGKGVSGMTIRDEDTADTLFVAGTHDYILFFTDAGRVFRMKGYQIPEAGRTAKGTNIINLLQLDQGEHVTTMLHIGESSSEEQYMVMVTKSGIVKRLSVSEIRSFRKSGLRVLTLGEEDQLISVLLTDGSNDILLGTKNGQSVRFAESAVRAMGRTAAGVIGIRMDEGDEVVGASVVQPGDYVLTLTENGYGKLTEEDRFPKHHRGGKGVVMHQLTEKTGTLAGMMICKPDSGVFIVTSEGTTIRTELSAVRVCGRNSQGVIIMRTQAGERVIGLAPAPKDDSDDKSSEEIEEVQTTGNETILENATEIDKNGEKSTDSTEN